MPLQATAGAATYDAFGGGVTAANYIEDVFSTYLYTGNSTSGGTQTITNSIALSTKGGMVWIKGRSAASNHILTDTTRGAGASATNNNALASNLTDAEDLGGSSYDFLSAFNTDGFTVKQGGTTAATRGTNYDAVTYASWTFRKQAKFFDVVTYTGNGANRTISHSLGSVPGCIIVKRTDTTADWQVYHRSLANTEYMVLNTTAAKATGTTRWNSTTPTATEFSLGTDTTVNANTGTYVAYLFAHDAGGFGASGTDNVISCGSYTGNGSTGQLISLGYEPQLVLIKQTDAADQWAIIDNMRGWAQSASATLCPNNSSAENATFSAAGATSLDPQGFRLWNANGALNESGGTYIYIAIRRGPMRTPTSGTSVFAPSARSGTGAAGSSTALGNVTDLAIIKQRGSTQTWAWTDRLRGATNELTSAATTAETAYSNDVTGFDSMTGFLFGSGASGQVNSSGSTYGDLLFRRAPGFFDVVCYTGDGTNPRNINHGLGAVPEFMIAKRRGPTTQNWLVYHSAIGAAAGLNLNSSNPVQNPAFFWSATPTSTQFSTQAVPNSSGENYVAYLFASCPGVSKVFSYTGNGSSQTINCGFTAGARFVLIKRTDSTGDWYVWDSARGIVAGNDPYLSLNSTAAEVTTDDSVDTDNTGFVVNQVAATNVNVSSATYIGLAVA